MLKKTAQKSKGRHSKKHGRKARVATKKGLVKRSKVSDSTLPKAERVRSKK